MEPISPPRIEKESVTVQLLNHPKRGEIKYDSAVRCFVKQSNSNEARIRLRGLKDLLAECFWPTYNYEKAKQLSESLSTAGALPTTGAAAPPKKKMKFRSLHAARRYGTARGEVVHSQIEDFISMSSKAFQKRHRIVHPYTYAIIETVQSEMNLRFLTAEEAVYSSKGHFATAIDQVCTDSQGRLVLIELKCGMDRYAMHGNDAMKGPLKNISNSPLNQSFVQALVASIMMHEWYGLEIHAAYVLLAQDDGTTYHLIPKKLVEMKDEIYAQLCAYAQKTLTDRGFRDRKRRQNGMKSLRGHFKRRRKKKFFVQTSM